jgi:hypothetical protein
MMSLIKSRHTLQGENTYDSMVQENLLLESKFIPNDEDLKI